MRLAEFRCLKTKNFINSYTYINVYVRIMKRGKDKLTLSVNKKIKDLYKQICEEEGLMLSMQIEKFMLNELKKRGKLK